MAEEKPPVIFYPRPEEKKKKAEPIPIETADVGRIYRASVDEWTEAGQTVFRPSALPAKINISSVGSHLIIRGASLKRIRIVLLAWTVDDEVEVTLYEGVAAISGPMDFGKGSEPRGIVLSFPYSPLELREGQSFYIYISKAVQVSGIACYYYQ